MSTISNIFSSETTGPIEVKFHMEPPWDGGTKVCSNGPGHMTKMAAMLIYGKNLKKSFPPEPKGRWPWILVCSIKCSSTTKFVQLIALGWPWPILRQHQNWSLMLLHGKKVKQWIFQKVLSSMIWNYQQMTEVTRNFCWHQNLSPGGCMPPAPGLYTCIKSWKKNCIKSDFKEISLKLVTNG